MWDVNSWLWEIVHLSHFFLSRHASLEFIGVRASVEKIEMGQKFRGNLIHNTKLLCVSQSRRLKHHISAVYWQYDHGANTTPAQSSCYYIW
jgi:hypothetical protein